MKELITDFINFDADEKWVSFSGKEVEGGSEGSDPQGLL